MKNVETFYPLTPMQQGLLFHSLYAPESGVYVEQLSCTLQGELDVEAFRRAWGQVVERHPALPEPVQVAPRRTPLDWAEEDWRQVDARLLPDRLAARAEAERRRGFDLSRPPLLRFALLRLGPSRDRKSTRLNSSNVSESRVP